MIDNDVSTRRSFLKAGAFVAVPLAANLPASALAGELDVHTASPADEAAIHRLHQAWLRSINLGGIAPPSIARNGAIGAIVADPLGDPDLISVARDGQCAAGRYACTVDRVTELPPDSTFAQMAHAQGGGSVRTRERGVLTVEYRKSAGGWVIASMALDPA